MKILSAAQTREADAYTIAHEPISSLYLMERAAHALATWVENHFNRGPLICLFCGPGNNGGDGLALARMLHQNAYDVQVFTVTGGQPTSADFKQNLDRLPPEIPLKDLTSASDFSETQQGTLLIDALFGTGLSRPVTDVYAQVIERINATQLPVLAVDIPSGLFSDSPTPAEAAVVKANVTLCLGSPKLAVLLPTSGKFTGSFATLPIGLHPDFLEQEPCQHVLLQHAQIKALLKPRQKFTHKGTYGHALLVGGSYGKIGAIVLSAKAALRAGVGLLTVQAPEVGYSILQIAVPEAMVSPDEHSQHISRFPEDLTSYQCLGIGPGLGKAEAMRLALEQLFRQALPPLVLDADALNLLAADRQLLQNLPPDSILTPHPKEFERLAGPAQDDFHRLKLLGDFCREHSCYVVLKGSNSCIGTPSGTFYFNTTGNPGMATGGTGDVLTGILTALRAQGYSALETCQLGVYLHGLAGDLAAQQHSEPALIASDLTDFLGAAFLELQK